MTESGHDKAAVALIDSRSRLSLCFVAFALCTISSGSNAFDDAGGVATKESKAAVGKRSVVSSSIQSEYRPEKYFRATRLNDKRCKSLLDKMNLSGVVKAPFSNDAQWLMSWSGSTEWVRLGGTYKGRNECMQMEKASVKLGNGFAQAFRVTGCIDWLPLVQSIYIMPGDRDVDSDFVAGQEVEFIKKLNSLANSGIGFSLDDQVFSNKDLSHIRGAGSGHVIMDVEDVGGSLFAIASSSPIINSSPTLIVKEVREQVNAQGDLELCRFETNFILSDKKAGSK